MKRVFLGFATLALIAGLASVVSAGGGKKKTKPSASDPAQPAVVAYNTGIAARDNAWQVEKAMAAESDTAKKRQLAAKLEGTYRSAAESFEKAISLDPEMVEAHSELGYSLRKLGDYENSIAAYDRALAIEPRYAKAIEYRAEAYLGLGRIDDAKAAYMDLFEGQSDQAPALLAAMQAWCATNPDAEEFSAWVAERAEIAGQAKSVSQLRDADW